ncbi:MAG: hypothetical protein AAGG51_03080 [Cyanobacteria bacterium P01_G01_bin.54]
MLEEGRFEIPELVRLKEKAPNPRVRTAYPDRGNALDWQSPQYTIHNGIVTCTAFPLVFLTSNGERAFPPPFLRRCLRYQMPVPKGDYLQRIVDAHLKQDLAARRAAIAQTQGEAAAATWAKRVEQERNDLIETFEQRCAKDELIATDQLLNALFMLTREQDLVAGDKEQLKAALMKQLLSSEDG